MKTLGRHPSDQVLRDAERAVRASLASKFGRQLQVADQENVTQDALLALHQAWGDEEIQNVNSWAIRVAERKALDKIRPERNWQDATDPGDEAEAIASRTSEAEALLEGIVDRERMGWLSDVVQNELPARYRPVIDTAAEGMTREAAAEKLGVSRATYCSDLRAALVLLREALANPGQLTRAYIDLATAYVSGVASLQDRKRAEKLQKTSTAFAAECAQQKKLLRGAALLLPPGVLAPTSGGGLLAAVGHFLSGLRDKLPWSDGGASAGAGGAAAGSGGGGALAAIGGSKVVAGCVAGAICVGGVAAVENSRGGSDRGDRPERAQEISNTAPVGPPAPAPRELVDTISSSPAPQTGANDKDSSGKSADRSDGGKPGHPEDRDQDAAPSSADVTGEEFDPLAAPPAAAPTAPVTPAPSMSSGSSSSSGGGSTSSGGSGSTAGNEFGP